MPERPGYQPHEALPKSFPNIHKEKETEASVDKLRREGEKVPEAKAPRIDAHFRRIDRALEKKPGLFMRLVKRNLLAGHTLDIYGPEGKEDEGKVGKLVQGLFESDKEILRRRGQGAEVEAYGDVPKPSDAKKYREQLQEKRAAQERGLSEWVEYLSGPDAEGYPTWYKYLVLRSLTGMGKRVRGSEATEAQAKVRPGYTKRSKTTIQPFPTLDRGALGSALDEIKASLARRLGKAETEDKPLGELERLADKGDFAEMYAHLQDRNERIRRDRELAEGTKGAWKTFKKGEADAMVAALKGKGTEWCIEGREVAGNYLAADGEFHIYFTEDDKGNPADPRVAVRLRQGNIAEVRGVLDKDQNLEGQFVDIAREKYKQFPGNERFEKADRDMKRLTAIEEKMEREADLTATDLRFLYEIDAKIEGFGYGRDPRIEKLVAKRNPKEDAPVVLGLKPEQIAWSKDAITDKTKSYIGPMFPGVFEMTNIEHLYASFPAREITTTRLELGGKTAKQYEAELTKAGFKIGDYSKDILKKMPAANRQVDLVMIPMPALGFPQGATTNEIYARAKELGLHIVPAEAGPALRLQYNDQPLGEYVPVGMEPITVSDGVPFVFGVARGGGGRWLFADDARPDSRWGADGVWAFARK